MGYRYSACRGLAAGQPIPETHPEVLGAEELLPGLPVAEFVERRRQLASLLPQGAAVVLPPAAQAYVTGIIPYPYRQDADFLYLTGITQPSFAVIHKQQGPGDGPAADPGDHRFVLFVPAPNKERERWDGVPLREGVARDVFGADDVYTVTEMPSVMRQLLEGAAGIFYDADAYGGRLHREVPYLRDALTAGTVRPLRPYLHAMRWIKSPREAQLMRESADLAARSIRKCMSLTHSTNSEHFLAATFEYECKVNGAQRVAYPPVVAGGADACTIHYLRNDKMLEEGKLVLMDAGCEFWGYASDVTRTWPVGGRFSGPQCEVYDAVLEVHRQCVDACRAGRTLRQIHALSVQLISQAIARLGLLGEADPQAIAAGRYRPLYCHSIGHWLGMDTHDTSSIPHDRPLQPGTVMAIEPGLYVPDEPAFGRYAGIGVRIEDVVAVQPGGGPPEVMSRHVPTDPEEIEAIVRGGG